MLSALLAGLQGGPGLFPGPGEKRAGRTRRGQGEYSGAGPRAGPTGQWRGDPRGPTAKKPRRRAGAEKQEATELNRKKIGFILYPAVALGVGALAGWLSRQGIETVYPQLEKSALTPPDYIFPVLNSEWRKYK